MNFTPTTAGFVGGSLILTDTNINPNPSTTQTIMLQGNAVAPLTISPSTLPGGTVGATYNQMLTATGGTSPYTCTVTGGTLPAGLTLSATGVLSGTPATANSYTR